MFRRKSPHVVLTRPRPSVVYCELSWMNSSTGERRKESFEWVKSNRADAEDWAFQLIESRHAVTLSREFTHHPVAEAKLAYPPSPWVETAVDIWIE